MWSQILFKFFSAQQPDGSVQWKQYKQSHHAQDELFAIRENKNSNIISCREPKNNMVCLTLLLMKFNIIFRRSILQTLNLSNHSATHNQYSDDDKDKNCSAFVYRHMFVVLHYCRFRVLRDSQTLTVSLRFILKVCESWFGNVTSNRWEC